MHRATIVGCGWVGLALAERWVARGLEVTGTTTRAERLPDLRSVGIHAFCIDAEMSWDSLPAATELLVVTVPPGRRHPERVAVYPQRLAELAARADAGAQVIYLSSTGVYGEAKGPVDELSPPAPVTSSARAVFEAENILRATLEERLTVLRLGGLVGPDRHPGRWFSGKLDAPNGDAPVNLVHRDDVCDAIDAVVARESYGQVFNVVASEHPPKREYYSSVCERFGYASPTFVDGGSDGKRVSPARIEQILERPIALPFTSS